MKNVKEGIVLDPRRDWVVVVEDLATIQKGGLYLSPAEGKKQNTCKKMKVIAKSSIDSKYVQDLCKGDRVLVREDDLTLYNGMDGQKYFFVEEQFILGRVNE